MTDPAGTELLEGKLAVLSRRYRRIPTAVVALLTAAATLGLVIAVFGTVRSATPTGMLPSNGVIVYTDMGAQPPSIPFENIDLFAVDPSTGRRMNITDTPTVAERSPVWSPDGTMFAYQRTTATGEGSDLKIAAELVVANANLTVHRVIRRCPTSCSGFEIAWSPDGSRLAWATEKRVAGGSVIALEIHDLASGATRTICDSRTCGYPGQPTWSPDGTKVAFSNAGGYRLPGLMISHGPIWVADAKSGRVDAITGPTGTCSPDSTTDLCVFDSSPAWSPDGGLIAFVRTTRGGQPGATTDLIIAAEDGSDPRTLTRCTASDQCRQGPIAWSPDGSAIAFFDRFDRPMLHLADPAGDQDLVPLPAASGAYPSGPWWSPDATQLAFLGGGRRSDLFLVDVATGDPDRVAAQLSAEGDLAWLPAGAIEVPAGVTPTEIPIPPQPATAAPGGSIVFSSSNGLNREDEGAEIWTIHPDGSGLSRLTENGHIDLDPAISPDGSRIAFASYRPGDRNTQIYVMNSDGTDQHVLTDRRTGAVQPAWSPEGTQIAFVSSPGYGEPGGIFVMSANGSGQRLVAEGTAFDPSWSPEGRRIVYALNTPDGETHLRVAELARGGETIELLPLPGDQREPASSPDGRAIAFVWASFAGEGIYTMRIDGSGLRKVAVGSHPGWSPDGSWLTFTHTDDQTGPQIWLADADGARARPVTSMPGFLEETLIYTITGHPSWGP